MKYNRKFLIYMHKNKINGKVYIGQTCKSIELRSGKSGERYEHHPIFYRAIQKYGWDNFEHIVLFDNLTQDEANEKEIELIFQYNARDRRYGYNQRIGGSNMCGDSNPFYGCTHTDATKNVIAEKAKIRNIGKNNPNYNHHKLKYGANPNAKEVRQYDKYGNLLNIYSCVSEAANRLGVKSCRNISRSCKKLSGMAYGYVWVYSEDLDMLDEKIKNAVYKCDKFSSKNPMSKKILQYSIDGQFIQEWNSIADAARYLNKKYAAEGISDCAKGKISKSYGYVWRYKEAIE